MISENERDRKEELRMLTKVASRRDVERMIKDMRIVMIRTSRDWWPLRMLQQMMPDYEFEFVVSRKAPKGGV